MSAPTKPWERPGINYQHSSSLPTNSMASTPLGQDRLQSAFSGTATASPSTNTSPPQVPPRPSQQSSYSSRLGTGPGYGGYSSYGGYGGYSSPFGYSGGLSGGLGGMYSPYSSYGGYNSYNRMGDVRSTFALQAEESSRPAFESIESIVFAVNSVGMMLDSTFQAVYNSFRAVIGVADNFTRLKSQLVQVFSALAFIRTLRYFYRSKDLGRLTVTTGDEGPLEERPTPSYLSNSLKLLELIRLRPKGEADKLWRKAFEEAAHAAASSPDKGPGKSMWPILMFFGIIMGGPYLIWRLISAFGGSTDEKGWAKGVDDHFVARANFSFQGQGTEELSFSAGHNIIIAPKELQPRVRGWLLASVDGQKVGMIPANYITVLGKRKGTKHGDSTQPPSLVQSDSSISLAQESQFSSPQSVRQLATVHENELESAFSSNSVPSAQSLQDAFSNSAQDSSNQEAADILSDADK